MGAFSRAKDHPAGRKTKCSKCIYRDADQDAERAAAHEWAKANPERASRRSQEWRAANPERLRERNRAYRDANIEAARERSRAWREANPDKAKAQADRAWHSRRARLAEAESDAGISVSALRDRDGDSCSYCGRDLLYTGDRQDNAKASIDHVVPLSRGGSHTWDNVVLACLGCNKSKGARTLSEWGKHGEVDGAHRTPHLHPSPPGADA